MMKRMSFGETLFLFFLALIIFGPKKLPEITRQAGRLLNEFRRASNEFRSQIEQEFALMETEKHRPAPAPIPPAGTASRTLNPASAEVGRTDAPASAPVLRTEGSGAVDAAVDINDEPLFATNSENSTGPATSSNASAPDSVSPNAPQESHV